MISVLVADAQQLLAQALKICLSLEPDLRVIDEVPATGLEAVEAILRLRPDVALLDYWITGMEGPAATRMVLKRAPQQKMVLLGWFYGQAEIKAARQAGASAFLSKQLTAAAVTSAVRTVARGKAPARPPGLDHAPARGKKERTWDRLVNLTPREIQILSELSIWGRPEEAARRLSITPNTMRLHIQHILAKTGARNQVEAVALARQHGLI